MGTFVGSFIVGIAVYSAWPPMVVAFGPLGGWLAALFIITPTWFMNHWIGLFEQKGAWVDQGIAIGAAGVAKGIFIDGGNAFIDSLPLILCVAAGGAIGGISAMMFEAKKNTDVTRKNIGKKQCEEPLIL